MTNNQTFYRGEEKLKRRVMRRAMFKMCKGTFLDFINKLFKKEDPNKGDKEQNTLKNRNDIES